MKSLDLSEISGLAVCAAFLSASPGQGALIGAWSLDEAAGTIADSSGMHPPGKCASAVRYSLPGVPDGSYGVLDVANSSGKSMGFGPARGQYFEIGDDNNTPIGNLLPTGNFTVMSWVQLAGMNTGNNFIIGTSGPLSSQFGWAFSIRSLNADGSNADIRFTNYGVLDNDSEPFTLVYGAWMHVAVTYEGGTIRYFLNGTQLTGADSMDSSVFTEESTEGRITIGARRGGTSSGQVNGLLDGVRVYDSILTEAEIQAAALESLLPAAVIPPPPYRWTGTESTDWSVTAANWDAGVWINGFDAVFDLPQGGSVSIPSAVYPHSLSVTGNGDWTATSVLAGISGYGTLQKSGSGTFTLSGPSNYSGTTVVNGGTLEVLGDHGVAGESLITVAAGGVLSGTGPFLGNIEVSGTLSPGSATTPHMTAGTLGFLSGSAYRWRASSWNGGQPGLDYHDLTLTNLSFTATPAEKFTVVIGSAPPDFTETAKTFTLATASNPITGFDPASAAVNASAFAGTGSWAVQAEGGNLRLTYTPGGNGDTPFTLWAAAKGLTGPAAAPLADPDGDGMNNLQEFALGSDPLAAASGGYREALAADTSGDSKPELILTIAVQTGTTFSGSPSPSGTSASGVTYRVEGGTKPDDFSAIVEGPLPSPVVPSTFPANPPAGYTYQSFRLANSNGLTSRGFFRVVTALSSAAVAAE